MFKQLIVVCLLVLIVTSKKHDFSDCSMGKCKNEIYACKTDSACGPTVESCAGKFRQPTLEQMKIIQSCTSSEKTAFALVDCIVTKCGGQRQMNKYQLNTLQKVMKKMH